MDILMDIPTVFIQLTNDIADMSHGYLGCALWFGHVLFGDRHFEF